MGRSSASSSSSSVSSEEEDDKRSKAVAAAAKKKAATKQQQRVEPKDAAEGVKTRAFRALKRVRSGDAELMLIKVPAGFDVAALEGKKIRLKKEGGELAAVAGTEFGVQSLERGLFEHLALLACDERGRFEGKMIPLLAGGVQVLAMGGASEENAKKMRKEALEAVAPPPRQQFKPMAREKKLPVGAGPDARKKGKRRAKRARRRRRRKNQREPTTTMTMRQRWWRWLRDRQRNRKNKKISILLHTHKHTHTFRNNKFTQR